MDINLILSAQTLGLAPQLHRSGLVNGLIVLKNIPQKTYLRVTPEQWVILQMFESPKTVPVVLGMAIRERQCLPLGEFYELVLKALRAEILQEPGAAPQPDFHQVFLDRIEEADDFYSFAPAELSDDARMVQRQALRVRGSRTQTYRTPKLR